MEYLMVVIMSIVYHSSLVHRDKRSEVIIRMIILPEVRHAGVLPDVAVRVPPDVGPGPGPHVFVIVLETTGALVLVVGVTRLASSSSRLSIVRHLKISYFY